MANLKRCDGCAEIEEDEDLTARWVSIWRTPEEAEEGAGVSHAQWRRSPGTIDMHACSVVCAIKALRAVGLDERAVGLDGAEA